MREIAASILIVLGTTLMFLASLGILRMPDVFMRLSATAKATTLGVAFTMAGAAVFLNEIGVSSRSAAIVLFICLTTPVAGHMIARAAYNSGAPLWKGTMVDELRGRYDRRHHRLESHPAAPTLPPAESGEAVPPEFPGNSEDAPSHPGPA
ncbi:MAG: monovalent cation/H(+) antiporter subunit G [Phycisphaerae bacterium]|nr:monovalent cation/H(+) antiporter subunit G [Phycisphaerae bacterium]HOL26487.1 monovalent cation/H(+) antiporter subunit G [Phycisphaerae bacterium]